MNAPRTFSRRRLPAFVRAADGATAVEFALVAFPFFLLIFAILEIAMVFMISTTLESSMSRSARTIRTGELQTGNAARSTPRTPTQLAGDFKSTICANLGWLEGSCASNLSVDVRTFTQFNSVDNNDPINTSTNSSGQTVRTFNSGALTFTPGGPQDIVLVRAFYRYQVLTPLMNPGLVELAGGENLITTSTVFRNEPYDQ